MTNKNTKNNNFKKEVKSYKIKQQNYVKVKNNNVNYTNNERLKALVVDYSKNKAKSIAINTTVSVVRSSNDMRKEIFNRLNKADNFNKTSNKNTTHKNSYIRTYSISKNSYKDIKNNFNKYNNNNFYSYVNKLKNFEPQKNIEKFSLWLSKRKEHNLIDTKENKLNKWINKKFVQKEKLKSNVKSVVFYPKAKNDEAFRKTFDDVRVGEHETSRETIDKLKNEQNKVKNTTKYLYQKYKRKRKFDKFKEKAPYNLDKKINRVSSINKFKKEQINYLNKNKYKGTERFLKKRKDLKNFKKKNRFLLRQRFVDRIKLAFTELFSFFSSPLKAVNMIFRSFLSFKTLLLVALPLIIISSLFAGFGMQAKTNAVNEDSVLIEQDSIFAEIHSSRYNKQTFLNEIKSKYKGYDSYEIDLSDVGYDNYELLAYLNIAYGNLDDNKDEIISFIREDLQEIFNNLYTEELTETRETKIEYVEEVREDGTVEKVPKEKEYVYLKVKVVKTNKLKDIYLERLASKKQDNWFFNEEIKNEDIDEWFNALVKNKLGSSGLFAVTINRNVAVSGIISREAFSSENSEFGEPKLNNIDPNGYGYPFGQCTWYAFQRRSEVGGKPLAHSFFGNGGDWWKTAQNLGMSVDHTPRPGDAASFPGGVAGALEPWGHVAFVEKVNADGSIEVSEMHGGNTVDGIIRYRHIPKEAIPYTYFIH